MRNLNALHMVAALAAVVAFTSTGAEAAVADAVPSSGAFGSAYVVEMAAERRQSIEPATTPDGVAAQKVSWEDPECKRGTFKRAPAKPLPRNACVPVVCKLHLPAENVLQSFNLRIEDASGETFQYYRHVPRGVAGWVAITNLVDVSNPPGSWGGNGVMDMPLSISG